jgi:hypothetical protein
MVAEILLVAGVRLVEMTPVAGALNLAHGKTSTAVQRLGTCPGMFVLCVSACPSSAKWAVSPCDRDFLRERVQGCASASSLDKRVPKASDAQ